MPPNYTDWRSFALANADLLNRDVDTRVFELMLNMPLGAHISQGDDAADSHKHEWVEDVRDQVATTTTAVVPAHAANGTGIVIPVADTTIFAVADQVFVDGLEPRYQVTSISPGVSITVTEIAGVALVAPAGSGNKIKNTRGVIVGSNYGTKSGVEPVTLQYNFTQIFRKDFELDRNTIQEAQRKSIYGIENAWDRAAKRAMRDVADQMNEASIKGIRLDRRTALNGVGYMGGALSYINVSGGNVITASGALTLTHLNDLAGLIYDDMGNAVNEDMGVILICNPIQNRVMAGLTQNVSASAVLNDPGAGRNIGDNVQWFTPSTGGMGRIPVILDRTWPQDMVAMINTAFVKWTPFAGQTLRMKEATDAGFDGLQGFIMGEYTLTVRDGKYRHGVIKNLTY